MSSEDTANKCNENQLSSHFQYQKLLVCGNEYLVGARRVDGCRQILLTDLKKFYKEKLSKESSQKRVEELNPLLPDCDIDTILDDLMLNIPKYTTSCSLEFIELEIQIEDGRFWFRINLTETDAKPFLDQQTEQLYTSLSELHHRYNCLLDLVKKKDKEIDEYKAQGVTIVKRSLVTEPFDEKSFKTKLRKTEPMEKLDIFLETMSFFNSIDKSDAADASAKIGHALATSETNEGVLDMPITNKKAVKKPSSSDIRCAVIPKIGKKVHQTKRNSIMKHM